MTAKPAFEFLERTPRSPKPRTRGITVASDKARSLADAASFIETIGDIVDHMKFPDHVGVMWRYSADLIRKKNALHAKAGIDPLHRLTRGVGPEHLIIECGPGAHRFDIAKWLIREFGPEVNPENIDAEDAYVVEAMCHGLNRASDYSYFHAWHGKQLPRIPAP